MLKPSDHLQTKRNSFKKWGCTFRSEKIRLSRGCRHVYKRNDISQRGINQKNGLLPQNENRNSLQRWKLKDGTQAKKQNCRELPRKTSEKQKRSAILPISKRPLCTDKFDSKTFRFEDFCERRSVISILCTTKFDKKCHLCTNGRVQRNIVRNVWHSSRSTGSAAFDFNLNLRT